MPVFLLPEDHIVFPHPLLANEDGLLAVGGRLTPERLLLAYRFGIFPWFNPGERVQWFFPQPRAVLFPGEIKIAKSMRRYFNQNIYTWSENTCFDDVMAACQRADNRLEEGTWIGDEVRQAFSALHRLGFAHSVEVWEADELVGGFYGVWLGKVFFGESMFSKRKNASKFGLISFSKKYAREQKLQLIDCQIENAHLKSLGARTISGEDFLIQLRRLAWPIK